MTLCEAVSNSLLAQWRKEDFEEAMVAWDRDVSALAGCVAIYSFGTLVVLDKDPQDIHAGHEAWRWDGNRWNLEVM